MRFGVLFEVVIQHDYWVNMDAVVHDALPPPRQAAIRNRHGVARYLQVAPTPATRSILAGHGMICKAVHDGFLVGVELEGATDVPRRALDPAATLRFSLRLTDASFPNYTAGIAPRFYRFSNDSTNVRAGQLFLTRPVAAHQPSRRYAAGEIRAQAAGSAIDLFQAQRDTGPSATPFAADWRRIPADTHDPAVSYQQGAIVLAGNVLFEALVNSPSGDLNDPTQWTDIGVLANQYVTREDQLAVRPGIFAVDVQSAAATVLELRVTRPGATSAAWQRRYQGTQPLGTVQADLRGLPDGVYRLDALDAALNPLPGLGFDFYLSDQAVIENWFGVVEIGAGVGAFALLDGAQQLRSPRYQIRFLNQAARLRYRFPRTQAIGAGAQVVADPANDSILVTPEPLPITRVGTGVRLRADDPSTVMVSEAILLPHPGARDVSKQGGQWFSEMHLSNFPPLA